MNGRCQLEVVACTLNLLVETSLERPSEKSIQAEEHLAIIGCHLCLRYKHLAALPIEGTSRAELDSTTADVSALRHNKAVPCQRLDLSPSLDVNANMFKCFAIVLDDRIHLLGPFENLSLRSDALENLWHLSG